MSFAASADPRNVWAKQVSTADFYFLEPGTARQAKALVESGDLICPEPTCPNPALTVHDRSRSGRRDGFAHKSGTAHTSSVETVFHLIGKSLLEKWARAQHPQWFVAQEVSLNERERIADVYAEGPGIKLALEVQFSPLHDGSHQERSTSYAGLGVHDIWFWVRQGYYGERMGISAEQRQLLATGKPLVWIDPMTRMIGTAYVAWTRRINLRSEQLRCPVSLDDADRLTDASVQLDFCPMEQAVLGTDGSIRTPIMAELERHAAERELWLVRRKESKDKRVESKKNRLIERVRREDLIAENARLRHERHLRQEQERQQAEQRILVPEGSGRVELSQKYLDRIAERSARQRAWLPGAAPAPAPAPTSEPAGMQAKLCECGYVKMPHSVGSGISTQVRTLSAQELAGHDQVLVCPACASWEAMA